MSMFVSNVSDAEKLNFSFEIRKVTYAKLEEAVIDFELKATYEPYRDTEQGTKSKSFQARIKTSEIGRIKEAVEKKKEELNEALNEIKDRIKILLELQKKVEVNLSSIFDELFDISKKGFVTEEEP